MPSTRVPSEPYRQSILRGPNTLRLDSNEGDRPPRDLLEMLGLQDPATLRDYPDVRVLEEEIATRFGIDPCRVVVTAGADDALDRACRAYLQSGRELLLPIPTFEMLFRFAAIAGGTVCTVPWDGPYPTADVIARISAQTALVAMVSPNNPTGQVASRQDLERVAGAAASALVLLDHAYVEYADVDLTPTALGLDNVVTFRTFSKAWGLAGCRVGYVLAAPEVAAVIRSAGNPYPVAALSIAIVRERLRRGPQTIGTHIGRVREERGWLQGHLKRMGLPTVPSQANFVFVELGGRVQFVQDCLASSGVLVRAFPHREEIGTGLRISLPGEVDAFTRLVTALERCLVPEALLFDLDGVLADVERSYRRCILDTARAFNVDLDRRDLENAVLAGDANNDWLLTQRLLAARGVDVSLEHVVEKYQALYLGTESSPGLRENESLIVSRDLLQGLASRIQLGVVTGRPRSEAEWFLKRFGIRQFFGSVVCLEDGPSKPHPAPIRLALEQLGVSSAWMIGDTPDDMRAARQAGVVSIGVVAPGDDQSSSRTALEHAGAITILEDIAAIGELLP